MVENTELRVLFEYERSTKGTHRYQEIAEATEPVIGTLYVRKWAIGETAPDKIILTIRRWEEETG